MVNNYYPKGPSGGILKWGYPCSSSIFIGFSTINQQAMGYPHDYGNLHLRKSHTMPVQVRYNLSTEPGIRRSMPWQTRLVAIYQPLHHPLRMFVA